MCIHEDDCVLIECDLLCSVLLLIVLQVYLRIVVF